MRLQRLISNFFGFSRAQTNGFMVLLPLIGILIFSEPLYRWWKSRTPRDFSQEKVMLDSLIAHWQPNEINTITEEGEQPLKRFTFDPNQATVEELLSLGFSPGLSNRLINYRNKGGSFRVKTDLLKLYGMDSAFYFSVAPYIQLPEKMKYPEKREVVENKIVQKKEFTPSAPVRFDLNQADTTLLKSVYGIGSKLSARIVQHRLLLGGFITADQLYTIYGLDSAVIDRLVSVSFIHGDFQPRTINLNEATAEELAAHPYISKRMATAMITYRFQHGKYTSIDDLRNILQLNETQLNAIRPYITVD
jgi:competence protein ComEA